MKTAFMLISFVAWMISMCLNIVLVVYIRRGISRRTGCLCRRCKEEEEMP